MPRRRSRRGVRRRALGLRHPVEKAAAAINAALDGVGLALVPEDQVAGHLAGGRLVALLEEWWPSYEGYHLYYPSRRQPTPAFRLLLEALRYRG